MLNPKFAGYGDPMTAPFWEGATKKELRIQRCSACGAYQFYPRPHCLACFSDAVRWVRASGRAIIYSMTIVRIQVVPGVDPPYVVAIVELEEGPRLLTNVIGGDCKIGDRVRVSWRERFDAPPLPVFEIDSE